MFFNKIVAIIFYCISIAGVVITNFGFFSIFLIGVTGLMIMVIGVVIVSGNIALFELVDYFVKKKRPSILPKNRKLFLSKITIVIFLLSFLLTLWDVYKPRRSMPLNISDIEELEMNIPLFEKFKNP